MTTLQAQGGHLMVWVLRMYQGLKFCFFLLSFFARPKPGSRVTVRVLARFFFFLLPAACVCD